MSKRIETKKFDPLNAAPTPNKRRMPLGKRIAAGAIATASVLGIYDATRPNTPELDATTTMTGNETAVSVATDVLGPNAEIRNLQDKLYEDSKKDGQPGYQPGEQAHVPQEYIDHLEEQQANPRSNP